MVRFELNIDDGMFEPVGKAMSGIRHLSIGYHLIEVKAVDDAGHESVTASHVTVEPSPFVLPGPLQASPLVGPAIGLGLFLIAIAAVRRGLLRKQARRRRPSRVKYDERDDADVWEM